MRQLYAQAKQDVIDYFRSEQVAITCDAWTSRATQSYTTLTCHHISAEWEIVFPVLQTRVMFDSHTGANVVDLLQKVFEEWEIKDKDPVLVMDNASNMATAAELSKLTHI